MRLLIFSLYLYLINSCKGSNYIFWYNFFLCLSLSLLILAYSVFPLPFPLDLKFYYHFRRQAFEEKIEYPSSLDKKGHLVLTVICEADFPPTRGRSPRLAHHAGGGGCAGAPGMWRRMAQHARGLHSPSSPGSLHQGHGGDEVTWGHAVPNTSHVPSAPPGASPTLPFCSFCVEMMLCSVAPVFLGEAGLCLEGMWCWPGGSCPQLHQQPSCQQDLEQQP